MSRPTLDETLRFSSIKVQFRITRDKWEVFRARCKKHDVPSSEVVRYLIEWWSESKKCMHGTPIHGGIVCKECKQITERKAE